MSEECDICGEPATVRLTECGALELPRRHICDDCVSELEWSVADERQTAD